MDSVCLILANMVTSDSERF